MAAVQVSILEYRSRLLSGFINYIDIISEVMRTMLRKQKPILFGNLVFLLLMNDRYIPIIILPSYFLYLRLLVKLIQIIVHV